MADTDKLREVYFGRYAGQQRPAPTSISEAASRLTETISEPMRALMDAGAGFLRGSTAGTLGAPADILNLLRVKQLGGSDIPYGYEYFNRVLPSAGPSQEAKVMGTLGQFAPLPSRVATAPLKAVAAIPGAIKHGATEFAKASALGAPHVMRTRGSQTIDTGLREELSRFYRRQNPEGTLAQLETTLAGAPESFTDRAGFENAINELKNEVAIKNWVQGPLAKYIKRDMGTPEDPVRLLAEEGIVHRQFDPLYAASSAYQRKLRDSAGFPTWGMGVSDEARRYENVADYAVGEPYVAGHPETAEAFELAGNKMPDWMAKLPEGTNVYAPGTRNMGFEHIVDVLREDLAAGRIRPEQVSKISMEQAVRRTHQYDQELAAKMDAEKAAFRSGLPVHKEYKTGYKWVELNKPGAFAAESDAMGHSVRGYEPPKGHPDWVEASGTSGSESYGHGGWEAIKSGRAKVYSLIDDKGRPHATVEVLQPNVPTKYDYDILDELVGTNTPLEDRMYREVGSEAKIEDYYKWLAENAEGPVKQYALGFVKKISDGPAKITQIKGKQNARPVEDYQPYIADFIRRGEWHPEIGDIGHTDLYDVGGKLMRSSELRQIAKEHGMDYDNLSEPYMAEYVKNLGTIYESILSGKERSLVDTIKNYTPPEFAEGGSVDSLRAIYFGR
jgi:hypothetical protein